MWRWFVELKLLDSENHVKAKIHLTIFLGEIKSRCYYEKQSNTLKYTLDRFQLRIKFWFHHHLSIYFQIGMTKYKTKKTYTKVLIFNNFTRKKCTTKMHQYQRVLQRNNEQHQKDYNFVLIFAEKYTEEKKTKFNIKRIASNKRKEKKVVIFFRFFKFCLQVSFMRSSSSYFSLFVCFFFFFHFLYYLFLMWNEINVQFYPQRQREEEMQQRRHKRQPIKYSK